MPIYIVYEVASKLVKRIIATPANLQEQDILAGLPQGHSWFIAGQIDDLDPKNYGVKLDPPQVVKKHAPARGKKVGWDATLESWQESDLTASEKFDEYGIRRQRDGLLRQSDWMVIRHKDEIELVSMGVLPQTSLTAEQHRQLLEYRQGLRDITKGDPESPVFPTKPDFV